jgi:hypothetical protein
MKLASLVACLGAAACSTAAAPPQPQSGLAPPVPIIRPSGTARGATAEEIAAAFIGMTVDFAGGGVALMEPTEAIVSPSRPTIMKNHRQILHPSSTICIRFDDGFSRCDTIYVDNGRYARSSTKTIRSSGFQ